MPSIQFCHDGLSVRVIQDELDGELRLVIEGSAEHGTSFGCHLDDLLAAAHGIAYQTGNDEGHVLIAPNGDRVRVSFSLVGDGNESCEIARELYERSLLTLKGGGESPLI